MSIGKIHNNQLIAQSASSAELPGWHKDLINKIEDLRRDYLASRTNQEESAKVAVRAYANRLLDYRNPNAAPDPVKNKEHAGVFSRRELNLAHQAEHLQWQLWEASYDASIVNAYKD